MKVMRSGYDKCMAAANARNDVKYWDTCHELWIENAKLGLIGWNAWWLAVMWAIPAMLLVYALAWVIVQTVKWIGRGRQRLN